MNPSYLFVRLLHGRLLLLLSREHAAYGDAQLLLHLPPLRGHRAEEGIDVPVQGLLNRLDEFLAAVLEGCKVRRLGHDLGPGNGGRFIFDHFSPLPVLAQDPLDEFVSHLLLGRVGGNAQPVHGSGGDPRGGTWATLPWV